MKSLAALAALLLFAGTGVPALARDSYVADNAHLLSSSAIAQINAKIPDFNALTHKEVFVDTEPAVDGGTPQAAAEKIMAQQQINGVLIYVAKSPKTVGVVPDRASRPFFPSGTTAAIRQAIVSSFNAGNFDGGINNGVDLTLSQYRSHLNSLGRQRAEAPAAAPVPSSRVATGGFSMSWIWWLIVLAVIFFIVRGIFRAMAGPRMYPPGYGGGPGYGGPGYGPGPGYGYGGGGGSFWSGLLGGLGGAWLGNELFGNRGNTFVEGGGGQYAGMDPGMQQDQTAWQNDAGQADMGNASFGGWGDSGGGGGDWGGGGGGDFGGGDGGGGW